MRMQKIAIFHLWKRRTLIYVSGLRIRNTLIRIQTPGVRIPIFRILIVNAIAKQAANARMQTHSAQFWLTWWHFQQLKHLEFWIQIGICIEPLLNGTDTSLCKGMKLWNQVWLCYSSFVIFIFQGIHYTYAFCILYDSNILLE